ncbi:MAG TPA: winged helix-turn-helix domain-containing protein [Terriglobales bacterium]
MENGKYPLYEFGGFQLDPARHTLFRQGQPVPLAPKLFETLVFLVEHRNRILPKDELIEALWAETFVGEGNLSQNVFLLRKALGDDRNGHSFIHTIPGRGYRFIAPVTETEIEGIIAPGGRGAEFWTKNSPFRSLTVFEPEDAWLFFGRDAETADLLTRLARSPVLAIVGNSGSGKSSLVRAGLIPALREGGFPYSNGSPGTLPGESWRIAVLRPSAAPFDYLAEVLPGQLVPELSLKQQVEFIAECREKLPVGGDALRNAVSALVFAAGKTNQSAQTRLLLVVDQFEELFTLTARPAVRDRYIDTLLAVARLDSAIPVHLVFVLRADFYGQCLDHPGLSRWLETSFNLGSMTPEQMRETIEKRLELVGGRAEPGLIDSLLEDVGAEPANLALLEHALGQLWERCGGPGCTFTNCAYNDIGRLRGALGRHADRVYQQLESDEQQLLAQRIFLELVHLGEGAQDTRRRVAKAELLSLGDPAEVQQLLARLVSSRLIATGREGEETFVEVSHEALIREWPALLEWLEENREELALERRLVQAAEEWESLKRDPGALLQGARLAQAEEWLSRHQGAPDLRAYVQASVATRAEVARKQREAQQWELGRQKTVARRYLMFSSGLALLLTAALGLATFIYRSRVLQKSRAMAAQAEELAVRDRNQALDLAIRGWDTAKTDEAGLALAKIFPEPALVLKHAATVNGGLVFSPDGRRILSGSADNTAKLWDARAGGLIAVLHHEGPVEDAEFSSDGRLALTASDDRTACVWDAADGHLIAVLKGHTDKLWRAEFSPDGTRVVTTSWDRTARVWDSADGRLLLTLAGHSDVVVDGEFSPDGRRIITTSQDRTARVWDSAQGSLLAILQGHTDYVVAARFSPDGRHLATASYDGTARIWNSEDYALVSVLRHDAQVSVVVFSPDSERIATASFDDTARLWTLGGRVLATLRHQEPVADVEFSPDGRYIATASYDRTARVWSARDGKLLGILQGQAGELYKAAFSPSGDQLAASSADGTVRTWNLYSPRARILFHDNSFLDCPNFSRDGSLLATYTTDGKVRVWSIADGSLRLELKGNDEVRCGSFSPDGKQFVTAGSDRNARVWRIRDGRLAHVLEGHNGAINSVVFSPDGQRLATASKDHTACVWNAADGRLLFRLQSTAETNYAVFSRDGQRIVTVAQDGTARVWSAANGSLIVQITGLDKEFGRAVLSPNNQYIVTGSPGGEARVWSATDGGLLAVLRGYTARIWFIDITPDSKHILTFSADRTARLWDLEGHLLETLSDGGHLSIASLSPDGRRIVSGGLDGKARVWNASDGRLLNTLPNSSFADVHALYLPDGRQILAGTGDHTFCVWEILTLDDIERILSK